MMMQHEGGQGLGKPNEFLGTLYYLSPEKKRRWPRSFRDLVPFGAILFVAVYDFVLYELRDMSLPLGLFGVMLVIFIVPSVVLLGASFYAIRPRQKASITLVIAGLTSAFAFFLHIVYLAWMLAIPPT